jgi:methionyl-tRNA synthetase
MSHRYFLTTAIDYVNGRPHLGHAYEKILADVLHRYHLSLGQDSFFLTGVDEHGQKVQQSAQSQNIPPQEFCDQMSAHFRQLWTRLNIQPDRFVRTTEASHQQVVRQFLQKLHDQDEIYFKEHEGFYSTRQEQFVTERDMVDGQWPEIFGEVVRMKEPNYFFRLSKYQDWLRTYLLEHPEWIVPAFRRNEVLAALERPLGDLCISRPKSRLSWGIPLPFDEEFVTYVWFDALVNYVSFAHYGTPDDRWPADLHIIGKDILVPAHAVYWPIMLQALGLSQPRQFLVHGWWLNRGAKISKSVGNTIDLIPYLEKWGTDACRYFLMREMSLGQDADFTDEKFIQRYQGDLAKGLGNLVQRSLSMLHRYRQGVVPAIHESTVTELERGLQSQEVVDAYRQAMDKFEVHHALAAVWAYIQRADQYVEQTAPWKLAKDPSQSARLDTVLAHLTDALRRISILIEAVLPATAQQIRTQLALPPAALPLSAAIFGQTLSGRLTQTPLPLFPRIEEVPTP